MNQVIAIYKKDIVKMAYKQQCAAIPVLPPVTARTNLATVTYPVVIATDTQKLVGTSASDMIWNIDAGKPVIDQFSILLTRKSTPIRDATKHIPVFSRLNKIKSEKNFKGNATKKQIRSALLKELRFAGIAFTGAESDMGRGTPSMLASVIGGSHTVMSYNNDHNSQPINPGTMVRWTLPKVNNDNEVTVPPVTYHGASGKGVFAELEPVNEKTSTEAILDLIAEDCDSMTDDEKQDFKNLFGCDCKDAPKCETMRKKIEQILKYNSMLQEREIGIVIHDNAKGSIDIRLK